MPPCRLDAPPQPPTSRRFPTTQAPQGQEQLLWDAAELTRCKGAMAEVLGFQQRTRTELAEATHAAAAARLCSAS